MSNRLDYEREAKLQPKRMEVARAAIQKLGLAILHEDETKIIFEYKCSLIYYYPYSGWATGKTIKDGRGLQHLLNQIRN